MKCPKCGSGEIENMQDYCNKKLKRGAKICLDCDHTFQFSKGDSE